MTRNQIEYWSLQETKRANQAREKELNRHQVVMEGLQREQTHLTYNLGLRTLGETIRSNQAREAETNRHNLAMEGLQAQQNELGWYNASIAQYNAETNRLNAGTNAYVASIQAGQLAELQRHQQATEALQLQNQEETARANKARENQLALNNISGLAQAAGRNLTDVLTTRLELDYKYADLDERGRHNLAQEQETNRSNVTNELLDSYKLQNQINVDSSKEAREWMKYGATSLGNLGKALTRVGGLN